MHLEPGEGGVMDIPLPPEVVKRIRAGAKVGTINGPIQRNGDRYEREVTLTIDGEPFGRCVVAWDGEDAEPAVSQP